MCHVRVVAALAHVDMVIRMHGLLGAQFTTQDFDGSVRDNLVDWR